MTRAGNLNARKTRARKHQLAVRDGRRCAYCGVAFASLREATLDHVAPLSLFRTWSARHLVLACGPCNYAKGNRLPLLLALFIAQSVGGPVNTGRPTGTPTDRPCTSGVNTAVWLALARLATYAPAPSRSGPEQPRTPREHPGRSADSPAPVAFLNTRPTTPVNTRREAA